MDCVLVVDDDPDLREVIASVLERAGYEAAQAADGAEALGRARERPPSLVVLDLEMPVLDGRGFLAACRAEPALAAVPVVLTSGLAAEAARLAVDFPAVRVLPKPFRMRDLLAAVDGFLVGGRPAGSARSRARRGAPAGPPAARPRPGPAAGGRPRRARSALGPIAGSRQ